MGTLRDAAEDAARARDAAKQTEEEKALAAERQRQEEARDRAELYLLRSGLRNWFPGVEWEWYGEQFDAQGYPPLWVADRPRWTNPTSVGCPMFLIEYHDHPDGRGWFSIRCVVEKSDSETHYPYFEGPDVKSSTDVGDYIRRMDERHGSSNWTRTVPKDER